MSRLIDRYHLYRIRTKRDPEAFAQIYDQHVKALYRFALLKLPSKEDAQDVTAETFTKAWHYLLEHQNVTHIKALLYQIARNLVADYYRNRPVSVALDAVTFEGDSPSPSIAGALTDRGRESELIEARAEMSLIMKRLEKLKDDHRDVLTLRLIDGLSFGDIAVVLEKSVGNVRVIYHRGLKAIKEIDESV